MMALSPDHYLQSYLPVPTPVPGDLPEDLQLVP